jgi:hypothetical protein
MKPRARPLDPFANPHTQGAPHTVAPWMAPKPAPRAATMPASAIKPPLHVPPSTSDQSVLEAKYPGIAHAVTLLWGHPEMNAYFERIWMADNPQTPVHPEAMAELMLLARVHQDLKPQRPATLNQTIYGTQYNNARSNDIWSDTAPVRRR